MKRGMTRVSLLVVLASCAVLGACSETKTTTSSPYQVGEGNGSEKKPGQYKIGKPYQIQGVWYYPAEDYSYSETGIASWYGPDFHAKSTANGEVFDQNDVTAAHRTLPMPCFVRVTNLENGRSLVVRINDRGPFAHGRILDLSHRAATLLGVEGRGTAKVRVEIMPEESRALAMRLKPTDRGGEPPVNAAPRESVMAETLPPPGSRETPRAVAKAGPPPSAVVAVAEPSGLAEQPIKMMPVKASQIYIQAGAFSHYNYANRLSVALTGIGQTAVTQVQTKAGTFFRVRMGPLANVSDADALLEKVIGSGYPEARIVVD